MSARLFFQTKAKEMGDIIMSYNYTIPISLASKIRICLSPISICQYRDTGKGGRSPHIHVYLVFNIKKNRDYYQPNIALLLCKVS